MAMYERYATGFYSRGGVHWKCRIFQEADSAFAVKTLKPGAEPLLIEWPDKEKEEVLCSSTATLTVVSPGDRTLIDLYAIKVGQIRLDVYRNDVLYWSGTIDPEFYEEPYSETSGYDVTLTFSDFGILDRIPYDLNGRRSLRDLLENALGRSCIVVDEIDESLISTTFDDGKAMPLSALSMASENFFDEDGEASTWKDVIEGIFQPLAIKMIQRAGKVFIFDLNGLYTKKNSTEQIEWKGSDAKLGTDKVYNNIRVTFSPYSSASAISGDLDYGDVFGPEYVNLTGDTVSPDRYSYYPDYDLEKHRENGIPDYNLIDFTIFRSFDADKCKGLAEIGGSNAFFKIIPIGGGQESEGVIGGFYTGGHGALTSGWPKLKGINPAWHGKTLVMRTTRTWLPMLDESSRDANYLHIQLPVLFDPRYNPFESEGDYNEGGNYSSVKSYGQFAFVPVAIVLYDADGQALCHYDNKWLTQNGHEANGVSSTASDKYLSLWGWKNGEASWGDAWLAYYDPDELIEGTGVMGWKTNRQSFGKPWTEGSKKVSKRSYKYKDKYRDQNNDFYIYDSFKKLPEGQFIPYPPHGGYLEVRVYNGVWMMDDAEKFNEDAYQGSFYKQNLYSKIRWLLYRLPSVTVVKKNLTFDDAEMDDVEYSGVVNKDARESLDLDTICGTASIVCPTAKGIYMRSSDGQQVQTLRRAGRTEHPEQLLIGTLYSQYADRKTLLSGETAIDAGPVTLYTERAQPKGTKFFLKGEEQNAREDTSKATYVEVRPDEYTGKTA